MYSAPINNLIEALKKLPSVGQKTAERFVFHWLASGKKEVNELRESLDDLLKKVKSCEICWNFSDASPCSICASSKRDQSIVCVVAEVPDITAIEKTNEYSGAYHVLRGLVDAAEENNAIGDIKTNELWKRLETKKIKEVILALNQDMPGETTAMYLEREIKKKWPAIKVTRLARGLPMGSDLQYADEVTLGSALKNRH
ncbi:MAG: recombination mediator RecR [Candidatus Magasanikbacteria bacterium]|nr:recombination mediator RecR [Candidatus Magasanikbacteria bacterium]